MISGTEIVFIVVLGILFLGPKRLRILTVHVARAKSQFEQARRSLKSQLEAELDSALVAGIRTDSARQLDGAQ